MTRPKRKAAAIKSYTDTTDYSAFEESTKKSKQAPADKIKRNNPQSTSNSGSNANGTKSKSRTNSNSANGHNHAKADPHAGSNGSSSSEPDQIPKFTNWQPEPKPIDYFSNKLNLTNAYIDLTTKTLHCPNQQSIPMTYNDTYKRTKKFKLQKGDFIYMISEPPGEPYYIGKIMGFKSTEPQAPPAAFDGQDSSEIVPTDLLKTYQFQVQWFYRPRDISKSSTDSRLLFASMHTDTCPLNSFRGVVNVKHKQDIENFDEFVKGPNCFYFDKLYDRYMMKFYDVLSTGYLLRIGKNEKSKNFLTALNKRFEYIFIEPAITKFIVNGFVSNSCTCETCGQWCSNQDSVNCADCSKFYHMNCLDPPLLKKPSRGFSWHCESCTKKHLRQYKNNRILMLGHDNKSSNELELINDIQELENPSLDLEEDSTSQESDILPKYELMAIEFLKNDENLTFEQRRCKEEWCMRYLGMHSKLEDGVDLDDRSPYPRASTGIGAKHQASHIPEYIDHPIVYYDAKTPPSSSKKSAKDKTPVESLKPLPVPQEYQDVDPKEYPAWLQPRPKGYIERGVSDGEEDDNDRTCTLLWKPLESDLQDDFTNLDMYVAMCAPIAEAVELSPNSPNFVDRILLNYYHSKGNIQEAMNESLKITKESLNEPILTKAEIEKFEEGVKQFGSELYPVYKMVKTVPCSSIVRFYYLWKKTPNGRRIWGNFEGRFKKKLQNLQNEKKESQIGLYKNDDDSSYESKKIADKHFICKYCNTENSIQWFRLSGYDSSNDKDFLGLCFRCARLWRRYGIVWQDTTEIERRISKSGTKKIDFEVLRDFEDIMAKEGDKKNGAVVKKRPSPSPTASSPMKKKKVEQKPAAVSKAPAKSTKVKQEPTEPKNGKVEAKHDAKQKLVTLKLEKTNKRRPDSKTEMSTSPSISPSPAPLEAFEKDHLINPVFYKENYMVPRDLTAALSGEKALNSGEPEAPSRIKQLCSLSRLINEDDNADGTKDTNGTHDMEIKQEHEENATPRGHCGVCQDSNFTTHDNLNCGTCGITVHMACVGYSLPTGAKDHKVDWLCDCCINDMHPRFELEYKCCLCNQKGGYLKPVHDSGKWAHLLCCLVNYKSLEVKSGYSLDATTAKKYVTAIGDGKIDTMTQNKLLIELLSTTLEIRNVDKIFVDNRKQKCSKCAVGGSLIDCVACGQEYHASCSGRVLFKFSQGEVKMRVNNKPGKVEPVFVCSNHHEPLGEDYLSLTHVGKRNQSSKTESTILQMFLEDLAKSAINKVSGKHLKAVNYLRLIRSYLDDENIEETTQNQVCSNCKSTNSPIWRQNSEVDNTGVSSTDETSSTSSSMPLVCQNCYHKSFSTDREDTTITAKEFLHIINEPITGEQFGIRDLNDRVTNIHTPLNVKKLMNH